MGILGREDDAGEIDQTATATMNVLWHCLPGACMITVRFGPNPVISAQGVRTWTEGITVTPRLPG